MQQQFALQRRGIAAGDYGNAAKAACAVAIAVALYWWWTRRPRPLLLIIVCMREKATETSNVKLWTDLMGVPFAVLYGTGRYQIVGGKEHSSVRSTVRTVHDALAAGNVYENREILLQAFRARVHSAIQARGGHIATPMDIASTFVSAPNAADFDQLSTALSCSTGNRFYRDIAFRIKGAVIIPVNYVNCPAFRLTPAKMACYKQAPPRAFDPLAIAALAVILLLVYCSLYI